MAEKKEEKEVIVLPQEAKLGAKADDYARWWTILCYEENISKDWKKILGDSGFGWVAIKHDKDYFEETGEKKKNHIHIFFGRPNGNIRRKNLIDLRDRLNGFSLLVSKTNTGFINYLLHKGYENKNQYSEEDLIFGGGSLDKKYIHNIITKGDPKEKENIYDIIYDIISKKHFREWTELIDYLRELKAKDDKYSEVYMFVNGHNSVIDKYVRSNRYGNKEEFIKNIKEECKENEIVETKEQKEIVKDDYDRILTKSEVESARDELAMHGVELDTSKKYTRRDIDELVRATIKYNI